MPVHIQDIINLGNCHPQIAVEYNNTFHKTRRVFSSMAIDQVHEQQLCYQSIGLTQSPATLRRWMVPGPEVLVRMTTEFEACIHKCTTLDERHHEQSRTSQVNFAQQVQGMVKVIGESIYGRTKDLLRLDTRDVVDHPAIASSICCAGEKGIEQFNS